MTQVRLALVRVRVRVKVRIRIRIRIKGLSPHYLELGLPDSCLFSSG
jgi:hypothetical protein